jgi:hypothetical protein
MSDYYLQRLYKTDELSFEEISEIKNVEFAIHEKRVPEFYPKYMLNNIDAFTKRENIIKIMGYALISLDWIKPLAHWIGERKCLEIMAGTGALSFALKQEGIDIIATDNFSWKYWHENNSLWTNVENLDAITAIEKYGKNINIIICSWAYMDDTLYKALLKMREINPFCQMIYIGEGIGGCTADDDFFDNIQPINNDAFENAVKDYPQWYGLHDRIQLGR